MRYIIIEKELGVFVGQFSMYAIFAKNEIFGSQQVASFACEEDAVGYVEENLNKNGREFCVEKVDSNNVYIPIKEIIKAGFGHHTHRMMDNIAMPSENVH